MISTQVRTRPGPHWTPTPTSLISLTEPCERRRLTVAQSRAPADLAVAGDVLGSPAPGSPDAARAEKARLEEELALVRAQLDAVKVDREVRW